MVVRIANHPFTTADDSQWNARLLGPAWITRGGGLWVADAPLSWGVTLFVGCIVSHLTTPGEYAYGTVYARILDGGGRDAGDWHYDLGEYTPDGAQRFVGTWRSDDYPIGNVFSLPHGETLQAPNRHVTSFHEGSDYHQHPEVPAVEGAWGVFLSATLYREGEPANLDCPRLEALRDRGPYGQMARSHRPVARSSYGGA